VWAASCNPLLLLPAPLQCGWHELLLRRHPHPSRPLLPLLLLLLLRAALPWLLLLLPRQRLVLLLQQLLLVCHGTPQQPAPLRIL
jgi:hypothetical protein